MSDYTKQELEEALRSHVSTINKCKKALPKIKEKSAQQTLLSRRIKALEISIELIEEELLHLLNQ